MVMLKSLNFWLFLIVLVCGISLFLATGVSMPFLRGSQKEPKPVETDWKTDPESQAVHLKIMNGTQQNGLAREFSLLVSGQGCVVETIGNAPGIWPESLLVNRRLDPGKSSDLARQLGARNVIRQWDERGTEDAVLILGDDFESLKAALVH